MAWTEPATATPGELITAAWLNTYIRDNLNALFPVGAFMLRAANYTTVETAVEGRWLQCNGVAVSRTTYVELFNLLNSLTPTLPFGSGNGTTTFNLPDLRGRMVVAEGSHADVTLGDNDGIAENIRKPKHYHGVWEGSSSLGGEFIVATQLDTTAAAGSFPTTPATNLADRGNHPADAPAHIVVGSYFIKYH